MSRANRVGKKSCMLVFIIFFCFFIFYMADNICTLPFQIVFTKVIFNTFKDSYAKSCIFKIVFEILVGVPYFLLLQDDKTKKVQGLTKENNFLNKKLYGCRHASSFL